MNEKKSEETGVEVQGIEVIELGDAAEETRQGGPIWQFLDSCCSYTYAGE